MRAAHNARRQVHQNIEDSSNTRTMSAHQNQGNLPVDQSMYTNDNGKAQQAALAQMKGV